MIDTDKYEGHSTGWKCKTNHSTYSIINDDGHKVASIGAWADVWKDKSNKDSQLIADAPLLLEEVKWLREAFITAVRHVGEHDLSRDDLFSKLDEDLFSLWLFRSE